MKALAICILLGLAQASGAEPREIIQQAIQAHGGEKQIAKTLTGKLTANATIMFAPEVEGKITWEESFELPRRYKRTLRGQFQGQPLRMEYAITQGKGWIQQGDGPVRDYNGQPLPLSKCWNAMVALIPVLLSEDIKLASAGTEKVEGEDVIGVRATVPPGEDTTLYFSRKTGRLMKSTRKMPHPLTGKEADVEVVLGDYKKMDGVWYPHRITSYMGGKKVVELQITQIEFLKKLDDRLFDKP